MKDISIGHFSKRTSLSIRALRLYDAEQLLQPKRVDPVTGYRYYAPEQLEQGHLIRQLRDCEMPLEQLRIVLQDPQRANTALREHRQHLEQRLREHQQMLQTLNALIEEDGAGLQFRTKLLPARAALVTSQHLDWNARHDDGGVPDMLTALQARLHRHDEHLGAPFLVYGCLGGREPSGDVQVCVPVKGVYPPTDTSRVVTFPMCEVVYTVHQGSYQAMSAALERLLRHVLSLGLKPLGTAFETLLSYAANASSVTEYRTELAIPVMPRGE